MDTIAQSNPLTTKPYIMAKQQATAPTAAPTATETSEATAAPIVAIKPEPTSPKLIELREQRKQHKIAARTFEPDSDGEAAELLEAYKCDQLIKAEIANILNAEQQAAIELARSKRIALCDNLLAAHSAFIADGSDENKAAFEAAREIVNNELLAKYSKPATVKVSADGTKTASTGEIDAAALANKNSGLNKKANNAALQAAGFPRSTAWFAVDRLAKADASYL